MCQSLIGLVLPSLLVAQVAAELVDPERGRVEVATKAFTGRT